MPSDAASEKLAWELRAGDNTGALPSGARGPTIRPNSVAQVWPRQEVLVFAEVGVLLTHDQEHRTSATLYQKQYVARGLGVLLLELSQRIHGYAVQLQHHVTRPQACFGRRAALRKVGDDDAALHLGAQAERSAVLRRQLL